MKKNQQLHHRQQHQLVVEAATCCRSYPSRRQRQRRSQQTTSNSSGSATSSRVVIVPRFYYSLLLLLLIVAPSLLLFPTAEVSGLQQHHQPSTSRHRRSSKLLSLRLGRRLSFFKKKEKEKKEKNNNNMTTNHSEKKEIHSSMGSSSSCSSSRKIYESINGPPPGRFINTTHGTTHYQLQGKKDSPLLVVLQHGLGADTTRWDRICSDILSMTDENEIQCQILRYDLYDRGYSETDPIKYPISRFGQQHPLKFTKELYVQQLNDVLHGLNLQDKPMIHVGHSLGGLIGISYCASKKADDNNDDAPSSNNIRGLVLIDAVCLPASKPITAKLINLPIIGNVLVRLFGAKTMMNFVKNSFYNPYEYETTQRIIHTTEQNVYQNPRYFASIRSTNAHCVGFVGGTTQEEESEGETLFRQCCQNSQRKQLLSPFPIHFIWGKNDTSVPYEQCLELQRIAKEEVVEDTTTTTTTSSKLIITELSFENMPHNIFDDDAKPTECSKSICDFIMQVYNDI